MSTAAQREFVRRFESAERIAWVEQQPCVVPSCTSVPCEGVHTHRDASSAFVVAACLLHRQLLTAEIGTFKFEALYHVDLGAEALDLELRWRQHVVNRDEDATALSSGER